jgi:hypothetical protein
VERDTAFDSDKLFSGGIRLRYRSFTSRIDDLKEAFCLKPASMQLHRTLRRT